MVSSSAGEGPGSPISRGLIERRILSRSMASGKAGSFIGNDGASHSTRCRRPRAVDGHFRPIVIGRWLAPRRGRHTNDTADATARADGLELNRFAVNAKY